MNTFLELSRVGVMCTACVPLAWLTEITAGQCHVIERSASDAQQLAEYGVMVGLDGTRAIVGAPKHDSLTNGDIDVG